MPITLGTQKQFDSDDVFSPAFINLTATTGICAYFFDDGVDDGIKAVHFTLAGGVITLGADVVVLSGEGNQPRLARLTDTSAMLFIRATATAGRAVVLTVSGTTITVNAVKTLSDTLNANGTEDIVTLTSTSTIVTYGVTTASKAVVLTVSGTTITENTPFQYVAQLTQTKLAGLTSTKVVVTYEDSDNSNRLTSQVLDISGTTITGNTEYELTTATGPANENDLSTTALTTTKYLVVFRNASDGKLDGIVVDEAATVLTPGALQNIETTDTTQGVVIAQLSASSAMIFHRITANRDLRFYEISVSGTTITVDDTEDVVIGVGEDEVGGAALDATTTIAVWNATGEAISAEITGALGLAAMTKPADIDAAGEFIYVALLEGGTPILTKISTALNADGVTVFDPGAGDNIGVECGRFSSDTIWVAGNFDGTNVIEKSEDGGTTFVVKDDATIGDVRAFVMGPDSDEKILVFDETNGDILET
ncbi:MAG: hypothetical protein ACXADH_17030, partial [Candidatus Kariarchaeaceae archaeon]